jgi:GNAT superfamily N-acetyltransferase
MQVRQVELGDRESLYAVSLATGFRGGDASHLYEDGTLIGHIYSAPYAQLEPGLTLVVEDQDGVAGFALGVVDTRDWEQRLEREWWPQLRLRYARPDGPQSEWSVDQRRAAMIHAPEKTPRSVSDVYPAHLHLNLLPRLQGRGIGAQLLRNWLVLAQGRGAEAVHVSINRENMRGLAFWARHGFSALAVEDGSTRTVWMGRSLSLV